MSVPAAPSRRAQGWPTAAAESWRANPFHRRRLGDDGPDRIEIWGRDPRVGDAERGREIGKGVWRIAAERLNGEHVSPWRRPHPSKHFTARLHSFAWLPDLAAVGPSAYGRIADLIDEWVSEFGEWDDLGWDPELTAERLFAWLCWGRPAFESGAPEQRAALLRSTARQARLLVLSENELGERHLGLIKAGAALVLAGAAHFPDAERFYEQGEEYLIEACAKQLLPDGGHMSRSPEAMAEALFDLVAANDALPESSPVIQDALSKLGNMVRMLRLGDGGLGCFNGGSESSAASIDAALSRASQIVVGHRIHGHAEATRTFDEERQLAHRHRGQPHHGVETGAHTGDRNAMSEMIAGGDEKRRTATRVDLSQSTEMSLVVTFAEELREDDLPGRRREQIGDPLRRQEYVEQRRRQNHVAESQFGRQRFRYGPDVDDAPRAIEGAELGSQVRSLRETGAESQ